MFNLMKKKLNFVYLRKTSVKFDLDLDPIKDWIRISIQSRRIRNTGHKYILILIKTKICLFCLFFFEKNLITLYLDPDSYSFQKLDRNLPKINKTFFLLTITGTLRTAVNFVVQTLRCAGTGRHCAHNLIHKLYT
jgi:hypothetical protein